jgi:hypothetical protein
LREGGWTSNSRDFSSACNYDDNGQLLTASFMDYLIPTVHEVPPEIRVGHVETTWPYTEFGIKGGGEGGRVGAPAIARATEDELKPLGVKIDALQITPARPDPRGPSAPARSGRVAGPSDPGARLPGGSVERGLARGLIGAGDGVEA